VLLAGAVIAVNIPTVGTALADRYHQYQITRPSYEAKYGLWVKLDIPARFRVNGIHSTLLHNGDVLIMAGSGNNQAFFNAGTFKTLLLNPVTMKERLIHTPWDLFCAGHIELPDGNILVAGGTARYENLKPTHAGGSMTVVNDDPTQPWHLPKGTIFAGPGGVQFASAFALTIPAAKRHIGPNGKARVVATKQNVWVDAVKKGKGSLMPAADRYVLRDLLGPATGKLYGVGTAMTLQKQDFQGTNDAYIFNTATSSFEDVSSMHYARWYPTLAEMGNGMVMTMSGLDGQGQVTVNSEMFNPATRTWAQGPVHGFPTYPATFLTEDGRLFFTGSNAGYGPDTPRLAHARLVEHKDRWLPAGARHTGSQEPGDQRLGAAAAGAEAVDHGPRRRRRRPVQHRDGRHAADRSRRPRPALGARAGPGPADPLPHHGAAAER
jgi:hypothetical protein